MGNSGILYLYRSRVEKDEIKNERKTTEEVGYFPINLERIIDINKVSSPMRFEIQK